MWRAPGGFIPEPPIYRFQVELLGGGMSAELQEAWREIELAANQTLADLGDAIPLAFDFDLDHLWSFYLSGKAWDRDTEYAMIAHVSGEKKVAADYALRDVRFPRKAFLYMFDYGNQWQFEVKLVNRSVTIPSDAEFPRIVAGHGPSPEQYPHSE